MKVFGPATSLKEDSNTPVHLERVHFDNVSRTKYDALVKEIRSVFTATTMKDLVVQAYEAKLRMEKDGLFDNMVILLDSCDPASISTKDSQATQTANKASTPPSIPVELSFVVKEPSRVRANVNTGINNRGEGQAGGGLTAMSLFGRGEVLSGEANFGHQNTALWHCAFKKPLLGWRDTNVSLHAYRSYMEAPQSQYSSVETGLAAMLSHVTFFNCIHTCRVAAEWRKLAVLHNAAAWSVREQAGHSLKFGLQNIIKYSSLDSEILPTRGLYAKLGQEIAGFGSDVQFLRHDAELRGSAPLPLGFFFTPSACLSYVQPLGGTSLSLIDRTYLGGPTDLRGFSFHGIGPSQDGAFMGGMASWSAGLHLFRPLFPAWLFFAHAFGVAGNICPVNYSMSHGDVLDYLTSNPPRCSLGVGLAIKLRSAARIEINYVWPFAGHSQDSVAPGLQFGDSVGQMSVTGRAGPAFSGRPALSEMFNFVNKFNHYF